MERSVEMSNVLNRKKNEQQEKYLPFILPFFAVKIHQKEKAGKQKEEGKAKGVTSNILFNDFLE